MKNEDLHLLINEEIYLVGGKPVRVDPEPSVYESEKRNKPAEETKPTTKVKMAFIHDTSKSEELALLNKIVDACDLKDSEFKLASDGGTLHYEKAVIFTSSANSYYEVLDSEGAQVMYSQPLQVLANSKEEKSRLWSALQEFAK